MRLKKYRVNYWSGSKLAHKILHKPFALGWDEWDEWHKDNINKHPIRYFITEILFDKIQDVIYFPVDLYNTIYIYVRNRFINKIHTLQTGLPKGDWFDLDVRLLCGCFNGLVFYVEKDARLEHIKWSLTCGNIQQEQNAKEILELYEWWKEYNNLLINNDAFTNNVDKEDEMLHRLINIRHDLWC